MLPEGAAWEKSPLVPMATAAIEDIQVLRLLCGLSHQSWRVSSDFALLSVLRQVLGAPHPAFSALCSSL